MGLETEAAWGFGLQERAEPTQWLILLELAAGASLAARPPEASGESAVVGWLMGLVCAESFSKEEEEMPVIP